ncbi:unnamed protein product [Leptidea sinapis]|uniref:RING-type domain-containing protein n=1 Tax=Leptidea sinapis TaxID=189913 RepID=A0A5E4Q7R7_9NEOP|nr:unnamed protein product [Leptidea sinapis]
MSVLKISHFLLQELPDITEKVVFPIKNIQRIKDGPITRLAISPDEKHIGFANGKGLVLVTECDQTLSRSYSSASSKEHSGNEVTALCWSHNMLFIGDDAKTMFHSSTQTIMSLDSRICQLDSRGCMLLISTLTRCYICNTAQEQYRQIGQKLRDGEFGACFVTSESSSTNGNSDYKPDMIDTKKYSIVDDEDGFIVGDEFSNTLIYCARPSSRLWEATVDGMVRRTHQFKQVLTKAPMTVITQESYENQNVTIESASNNTEGSSINFSKTYSMSDAIFSYNRQALYFLNVLDVDDTVWYNKYTDIVECKIYKDMLYIWLQSGAFVSLKFMKLDKFLVKCFLDEKYNLCAELCVLYKDYLLAHNLSTKMHILLGLKEKLENNAVISKIADVLDKLEKLKSIDATQLKSGIYVVDNTYHTQSIIDDHFDPKHSDENLFNSLSPEALQALKGLSETVSGKFNTSKKILKEKWDDFEEKIKQFGDTNDVTIIKQHNDYSPTWISKDEYALGDTPNVVDDDIIFKESSQESIEVDNNVDDKGKEDRICRALYQYSRLSLVNKETEISDLSSIIEVYSCDIKDIYELMILLEQYCINIGAVADSKYVPNNIFLSYLNTSARKHELLEFVINDEVLYKYFVESCISVNVKTQKLMNIGCSCGYPLPYVRSSQMPVFFELIDEFVEMQWSSQTKEQCYEMCKQMPYLWRKILYLRRNEDLLHVLRILLQMLDETLLHSFLPQFTLDTWDRALQLYATLHADMCLNCAKKFENISVKDMLSWDDMGSLIIKSIGGRNAISIMQKHSNLIERGAITMKFYHCCLLVCLFEKYDIRSILLNSANGHLKNTALPLLVGATSTHWGLPHVYDKIRTKRSVQLDDVLDILAEHNNTMDCSLCGLPLQNDFLIKDGGLWIFKCGHIFHGACLNLNKVKLCPSCIIS